MCTTRCSEQVSAGVGICGSGGRSASTVRRWEREGLIHPARTVSGQRYFTEADVLTVLGPGFAESPQRVMVYRRGCSAGQRDDLVAQVAAMGRLCAGRG
jgi:putative resolvase